MLRAIGVSTLFSVVVGIALPTGEARAGCFPQTMNCCDSWGYSYPGTYGTANGCENAGGIAVCGGLGCPNQSVLPFKCCDAAGDPVPGVYTTRHSCKVSGYSVFENKLLCPGAGPFQCCTVDGDDAPDTYLLRTQCQADGYVVQDYSNDGCPNGFGGGKWGWKSLLQVFFPDVIDAMQCAKDVYKDYNKPDDSSVMKGWKDTFEPDPDVDDDIFDDKDSHCITNCLITARCGKATATAAGWARETLQMCDGHPENAWGWGDECANRKGRQYAVDNDIDQYPEETYAQMCHDYCVGITDLQHQCDGFLEDTVTFVGDLVGVDNPVDSLKGAIENLNNSLGSWWAKVNKKCAELAGGGLTLAPDALPNVIFELTTQGQAFIARANTAGATSEGDIAAFDEGFHEGGATVRVGPDGEREVIVTGTGDTDVSMIFDGDGALGYLSVRGTEGNTVLIGAAPAVEIACSNPPCERRLPWLQWTVEYNEVAP